MATNETTAATADYLVHATAALDYRMLADVLVSRGGADDDVKRFWQYCLDQHGQEFKAVLALVRDGNPRGVKNLAAMYLAR